MPLNHQKSVIEEVSLDASYGLPKIYIKRDDLIDPVVGGNKVHKLKYNLKEARESGHSSILTFGGAFSNHIAATAAICKKQGLSSIGIIRGERPSNMNPTLDFALKQGMKLHFISRTEYKRKNDINFLKQLSQDFENPYLIPEGGSNQLGIKGASEMLDDQTLAFDHIFIAVGTGTSLAGILHNLAPHQMAHGVLIHKHKAIMQDLQKVDSKFEMWKNKRFNLLDEYHFNGYAKWNEELLDFIRTFFEKTNIKLDPIYTGKAMHALLDQIKKGHFSASEKILFIHTGGIQGIAGFESRFNRSLFSN